MGPGANVLSFLAGVTVRSLVLILLAGAALLVFRVKSAAARHAIWTVTAAGMLLLAATTFFLPPLPIRVLGAEPPAASLSSVEPDALLSGAATAPAAPSGPVRPLSITWREVLVGIYLAGVAVFLLRLAFSYLFTARLVRSARPAPDAGPGAICQSSWISVPLTIGWLRPSIILPEDWREWDTAKLRAVLIHEQTHVQRGDWAIALIAGVNRCLFWFHPAAWWLEHELATLAEQACDDAALLKLDGREVYAQALLDMAAAVKRGGGRLVWEAMAMAKASEVRMRIERILDESRQISNGLSRLRWVALAACSLPLIYVASVAQLAPALAQEQTRTTAAASAERPDFGQMEQYVAAHPDDLEARSKLIRDYYLSSIKQPRLNHIYWMIQNHPESELTALNSTGILPRTTAMNDETDYQTAAGLWRQGVSVHAGDAHVLANAARFFAQPGADPYEAERLLNAARSIDPRTNTYTQQLGRLYSAAIISNSNPAFASTARSELEASTDSSLLSYAGSQLSAAGRNTAEVAAHPELKEIADLGNRLMAKAQAGMRALAPGAVMRVGPPVQATSSQPNLVQSPTVVTRVGPPVQATSSQPNLVQSPTVVTRVAPQYPPLARTSRIEGTVQVMTSFGPDGRVTDAVVVSGPAALAGAALDAVRQWIFTPVMQNGVPTAARTQVAVPFHLDEPNSTAPAALAAQVQAPPPTPQRIRVGGNVQTSKLITKIPPVYPQAAKDAGIQGTVELQVLISKEGKVSGIQVLDGNPLLAAAAQDAVMQWVYAPTLLNNNPVEVQTTVSVPFE